jgi:steroid 5-alpha reductase family enzyme
VSPIIAIAGTGWIIAAVVMTLLWLWQRRTKNAAAADAGWTALVAGLAIFDATQANGMPGRRLAIASMMGSWGARLTVHLLYDRVLGKPEDGRYGELRRAHGWRADRWFFWVFQSLAAAAVFFSLPALIAVVNPALEFSPIEYAAAALWAIAFAGESTADRQLLHFKMEPANAGRTCQVGLWRYSRHPNYFFEWLMWIAYALFAAASPWGWLAAACPLVMLYLLLRVTGIPPNEAQALRTRGDDYRDYQRTTSAFVPWLPAREAVRSSAVNSSDV